MSKKQTSIEWLIDQLKNNYGIDIERLLVTDKAKAEAINLIKELFEKHYDETGNYAMMLTDALTYYSEIYGKE